MLQLLIMLAGILVGVSTGLQMSRVLDTPTPLGAAAYFPRLSVAAALIAGVALARSALIGLTGRWPQLAPLIAGPALAIYGFVWFQNSLVADRLASAATMESDPSPHANPAVPDTFSATMTQVGLGVQLGLLVCAAGVRDLPALAASMLAALIVATPAISGHPRPLRALRARADLWQSATGALLCALGAGTLIQRMTDGALPSATVALVLVISFWTATVVGLRWPLR